MKSPKTKSRDMSGSKFSAVLAAAKGREASSAATVEDSDTPPPGLAPNRRPRGGKRGSSEHGRWTAYVRRDTYQRVRIELLKEASTRDFSDLTQELLDRWLKEQK